MNFSYRAVNTAIFATSVIGMAFALYLQHFQHLSPCPLCIFQRIGLMAMGFFALLALLHNPKNNVARRIYGGLATLGILWSVGVAARHVWIQHLPPDQVPACGPGLNYLMDTLPLTAVLKEVFTGSGECANIDWVFLGQSLPFWSLVFFSVLLLLCLWQTLRKYPR